MYRSNASEPGDPVGHRRGPAWVWPSLAALASLIPVLPGLSTTRIFYARDLSSFFWGRYLWLRREWLAGHWPLWDPHVGGGQAAYSDGLHQMFLLPAMLLRLVGNEALGFNLWVVAPFPIAAIGAWLFLARRSSPPAAALGAVAFAASGPVAASGNFPNLSWSVALIPWILWAVDRLAEAPRPRAVAVAAMTVAAQALAGEPVTLFTTLGTAMTWAAVMGDADGFELRGAIRRVTLAGFAIALGMLLAAVQLVPMTLAASLAERGASIVPDAWSLRPTALFETMWLHLFGNYFEVQSLAEVPWMPLMYTGREPLLFSIYLGVPSLALSVYGLGGDAPRRLRLFWVGAGLVSLVAAFGSYTPFYPLLRDHVPPFGSFRFPVKYIYVAVLAVATGAALGFDQLLSSVTHTDPLRLRRQTRATLTSVGFAGTTAAAIAAFGAGCAWLPSTTGPALQAFAALLGDETGKAAEFMLRVAPRGAIAYACVAAVTAALLATNASLRRTPSRTARLATASVLALLVAGDLLVHAWGVNPVMPVDRLREPAWLARTTADANSRFYVGGKRGGTLDSMDFDSSRGFLQAPGLRGSASRATLNIQAAFYPSGWGGRELLSYDLPVLWPRLFYQMTKRFDEANRQERDRFLDRTGTRFRILPQRRAGSHQPLMPIPQFYESFLYDFGDVAVRRASIVSAVQVVADPQEQMKRLFTPGWDSRDVAFVTSEAPAAGRAGEAASPDATIRVDESNRTIVDARVAAGGGYLVLLDSYSDDWRVSVDAKPARMMRANGLFRAVHLTPGTHTVAFTYRPRALLVGVSLSLTALLMLAVMLVEPRAIVRLLAARESSAVAPAAEAA